MEAKLSRKNYINIKPVYFPQLDPEKNILSFKNPKFLAQDISFNAMNKSEIT